MSYTDLYVDDAPHGTRTTYFLAATVCYRALFLESPDVAYMTPGDMIVDAVRENFGDIVAFVDERLAFYNLSGPFRA